MVPERWGGDGERLERCRFTYGLRSMYRINIFKNYIVSCFCFFHNDNDSCQKKDIEKAEGKGRNLTRERKVKYVKWNARDLKKSRGHVVALKHEPGEGSA